MRTEENVELKETYNLFKTLWYTFMGALFAYLALVNIIYFSYEPFYGICTAPPWRGWALPTVFVLGSLIILYAFNRSRARFFDSLTYETIADIHYVCQELVKRYILMLVLAELLPITGLVLFVIKARVAEFTIGFLLAALMISSIYPPQEWWDRLIAKLGLR